MTAHRRILPLVAGTAALMFALSGAAEARQARFSAKDTLKSVQLSGLRFRNVGPAMMSGRVSDFAVMPNDRPR